MNRKFKVILICLFFIFIAGIGVFFYLKNTSTPPKETNYEANRTSNKNEQTNKNNETAYQKLNTYSSQAVDPQIKQLFSKSAQDALNTKQKLMTFLNN